jgi:glutathione S-transferase
LCQTLKLLLLFAGKSVYESLVIVEYVDEAWPGDVHGPTLHFLPKRDLHLRAVARTWTYFVEVRSCVSLDFTEVYRSVQLGGGVHVRTLKPLRESLTAYRKSHTAYLLLSNNTSFFNEVDCGSGFRGVRSEKRALM